MSDLALGAALCAALVTSRDLQADSSNTIVLLSLSQDTEGQGWAEAEYYTRAELMALGFEVETAPVSSGDESELRPALADAVRQRAASLAVAVVRMRQQQGVELWLADAASGQVTFQVLPQSATIGDDAAKRVALHVVELVNANLVERSLPPPAQPQEGRAAAVVATQPSAASAEPHNLTIGAGTDLVAAPGGVGAMAGPGLHLGWAHPAGLISGLQLTLAVLSAPLHLAGASAEVGSGVGRLYLGYRLWPGAALSPELSASLGALYVWARGQAEAPLVAHDVSTLALLPELAVGCSGRLARQLRWRVGLSAGYALPDIGIRFGERTVAVMGRPLIAARLGLDYDVSLQWLAPST